MAPALIGETLPPRHLGLDVMLGEQQRLVGRDRAPPLLFTGMLAFILEFVQGDLSMQSSLPLPNAVPATPPSRPRPDILPEVEPAPPGPDVVPPPEIDVPTPPENPVPVHEPPGMPPPNA